MPPACRPRCLHCELGYCAFNTQRGKAKPRHANSELCVGLNECLEGVILEKLYRLRWKENGDTGEKSQP
ncbi:hypothetical protein R3I93_021852 [Phoxinus phoxinus]|uniref:Uncharacterized protein n=1 Tax=Phoxinus phoxinus TaxID=58324 RepID=A0AAN9GTH1_9TELE